MSYFKCVSGQPCSKVSNCQCDQCKAFADAKADLLSDFRDWSGGFTPDECDIMSLRVFAEHAADHRFTEEEVMDFLKSLQ